MRKFSILAIIIAFVGCSQYSEKLDIIISTPTNNPNEFYASMPECDTRTYVEDNKYLRWNADDEITVFAGNSYNSHWQFAGENGANSGKFNEINEGGFVTGSPLDLTANYAIYPYDENITISEAGAVSLTLPAVQEYNHAYENSFGAGANTMMAVTKNTSDNFLSFKNLCGYLKLKFYGNDVTVKSITVKGNNGEKIAGPATVSMAYGSEPTITMGDDATDTITVDCGEGVALSSDNENPTIFWVVIPEITFEGGITIEVTDINDQTFSKQTTNAVPIENNLIQPMAVLEVEVAPAGPANNEIWYTSSNGNVVTPYATDAFNANIVSNTYDAEKECWVIKFDGDVTTIGSNAFNSRTSLTSITIPDSVTTIGGWAFYRCDSLASVTIPDSVTTIGSSAFKFCTSLTSVTIPDSVTMIGDHAFDYCSRLTSVTIPDSVTTIGSSAFAYCMSLTSVYITDIAAWCKISFGDFESNPLCYAGNLYLNNELVTDLIIPDSVTLIGRAAFYSCTSLTSVTIPDSVTSIGDYAFYGCTSLTSITIPDSVTTIGDYVFDNCESLTSVTIPDSVTSIGSCAFYNCTSLTSVTIPDSVTTIGESAFSYCTSLTSVTIGKGVTSIGESAFCFCYSLTSVTIPDSVTSIGDYAFGKCTSLTSVTIPDSVTTIGGSAFRECTSLTSVTIGKGVTSIDGMAFYNCTSLTSVTIPDSVTAIGESAFSYCTSLKEVYCKPTTPPTGDSSMFSQNASDRTIYVPSNSVSAYKSASGWSDHSDKIFGYNF